MPTWKSEPRPVGADLTQLSLLLKEVASKWSYLQVILREADFAPSPLLFIIAKNLTKLCHAQVCDRTPRFNAAADLAWESAPHLLGYDAPFIAL